MLSKATISFSFSRYLGLCKSPGFDTYVFFFIRLDRIGARSVNDTVRRFLSKIDRLLKGEREVGAEEEREEEEKVARGENKNKFPRTYTLLVLPSEDNSLARQRVRFVA